MKGNSKKRQRKRDGPKGTPPPEKYSDEISVAKPNSPSQTTHSRSFDVSNLHGKKYLTPEDGQAFQDLIHDHYQGFVHVPADQVASNFDQTAKAAFERLRDANYYQYDIVKAGGKHASRTFVKRTLVGEPGITYKYLGLRLFAHAWSGPGVPPVMKTIGDLNRQMVEMTKEHANYGNCEYNLTLINFMEPSSHSKVGFKDEAFYGMGKVSVSWHADSSLEKNSSIGVYHCLPSQRSAKWDWKIALRRIHEGGREAKDIPPVATSTESGDIYFLLGTFNETHQHCVLSGSESTRISSTHRCAVTSEDTYDYIRKRTKGALKRFRLQLEGDISKMDAKVIVYCQRVLTEVEMEWIAQYWLQGAEHDKMHVWWQRPMKILEALWLSLEELTLQLYELCVKESTSVPRLAMKGFLLELQSRQDQRQEWEERRADKIYKRRIKPPYHPVARPLFDSNDSKRLGKELEPIIKEITKVREGQLGRTSQCSSPSKLAVSKVGKNKSPGGGDDTKPRKQSPKRQKR
jgi:alpha-ketoglutarate-dependent dioxygenase FTO